MAASPSRVLVIDDDEGLNILVAESLKDVGLQATTITSGARALAAIKKDRPDLMLLDLKLSDLSGPALLEQLRNENIPVPFIIVTGQGDERVAVEMMKQGALDYLIKDASMLDRLPLVVKRAADKLESDRALTNALSALLESEKQILAVSEGERQRIGADLHDNLGQQLTAIELLCHSLREDLRDQPPLERQAGQICRFLRDAVSQTRQLARGLMPVSLEADGLIDGLAELVRRMGQSSVQCEFVCNSAVKIRDTNVAGQLYRIAQEAVNNAMKHAHAGRVVVTLSQHLDVISLQIKDDGRGLSETKERGLGLQIMRHRANVIGATLKIDSAPGRGVTVTCILEENS